MLTLAQRLRVLANRGSVYDPKRVQDIQKLVGGRKTLRTAQARLLLREAWEHFAEGPFLLHDVNVADSDKKLHRMPEPGKLASTFPLATTSLCVAPRTLQTILDLVQEREFRMVAAFGESESPVPAGGVPITFRFPNAGARLNPLAPFAPALATAMVMMGANYREARDTSAEGKSRLWEEYENVTCPANYPARPRTPIPYLGEEWIERLRGTSLATLGIKNPYAPILDLATMGVDAYVRFSPSAEYAIFLPPSPLTLPRLV